MLKDFTPTKGMLAWTAVGASVLTMVVGFTWGGWVTGGTAEEMSADAATAAHVQLASTICADNFVATPLARAQHQELSGLASYQQRGFVEDQSWALMPGETSVSRGVAEECARTIAAMEVDSLPVVEEVAVQVEEAEVDPG